MQYQNNTFKHKMKIKSIPIHEYQHDLCRTRVNSCQTRVDLCWYSCSRIDYNQNGCVKKTLLWKYTTKPNNHDHIVIEILKDKNASLDDFDERTLFMIDETASKTINKLFFECLLKISLTCFLPLLVFQK